MPSLLAAVGVDSFWSSGFAWATGLGLVILGWLIVGGRTILGGTPPRGLTGLAAIPAKGLGGGCTIRTGST